MKTYTLLLLCSLSFLSSCAQEKTDSQAETVSSYAVEKTEAEWQAELSEQEYDVIRKKGTERPFTGDLLDNKEAGTYVCRACQHPLFESASKFESGTGWPSFYAAIHGHVEEDEDTTFGMSRIEILCEQCGGHLGHVFGDGPAPTGLRYCVNSVSLDFVPKP